jgi:hypothetical protein
MGYGLCGVFFRFQKPIFPSSMSELDWEHSIFAIFFPRKPCYARWNVLPPLCGKKQHE